MTQLTDKIREGILGNVGTIMAGRLGVTDAELMEKAFTPVFNAEDLHKQGNYQAIATVMMYNLPSAPFTMSLLPPMGNPNPQLLETMKEYSASRYAKTRAEVEAEIKQRWQAEEKAASKAKASGDTGPIGQLEKAQAVDEKTSFLDSWKLKKAEIVKATNAPEKPVEALQGPDKPQAVSDSPTPEKPHTEPLDSLKTRNEENQSKEAFFKVR